VIPRLQRKLTMISLCSIVLLAAIAGGYVVFTDFTLR